MPDKPHKEIPQQWNLAKDIDPAVKLKEASKVLGCDLDHFRDMRRINKADRDDRDLLVLSAWKTGLWTNAEIGRLFGVTYSSISHIVRSIMLRIDQDQGLKAKFDLIYSLFKI